MGKKGVSLRVIGIFQYFLFLEQTIFLVLEGGNFLVF